MKNKIFFICLIFIFCLPINSHGTNLSNLIINDKKTNIKVQEEFNGDYFLPLRDVIIKLGGNSHYDSKNLMILFSLQNKKFSYSINDNLMEFQVNGNSKSFNNYFDIHIENGISYIPLSFLNRFFGTSYEKIDDNLFISSNEDLSNNFPIKPLLITHGGGKIHDKFITNSLEAINNSIENGSKLIEIDFLKTSDNKFVLGHDWSVTYRIFKNAYGRTSYEKYITKNSDIFTPLGLDDLIKILDNNKDLSIVTDTTDDNKEFLSYLSSNYKSYMSQFKVQVYSIDEYYFAKSLGFKDIIYSMYQVYLTDSQVLSFAKNNKVYAITMAESRALSGLAQRLTDINVMTYVHTINDLDLINKYKKLGVMGFYTDILY